MLRALLVGLSGAASFAIVYAAMGPSAPPEELRPGERVSVLAELRPTVAAAAPIEAVTIPQVRNVTPRNVTAGPAVSGTLTRIEPPARPKAAEPPQARTERLFSPLVAAAGIIKTREREIRLAGIAAPNLEARCGEGEAAWPCGRMARAALRRFIRGRAIECDVPASADAIPEAADCSVAGQNLSEWLLAQGWAAREGERYADIEAKVRAAGLGIWGAGRPGAQLGELAASAPDSAASISARVSATP